MPLRRWIEIPLFLSRAIQQAGTWASSFSRKHRKSGAGLCRCPISGTASGAARRLLRGSRAQGRAPDRNRSLLSRAPWQLPHGISWRRHTGRSPALDRACTEPLGWATTRFHKLAPTRIAHQGDEDCSAAEPINPRPGEWPAGTGRCLQVAAQIFSHVRRRRHRTFLAWPQLRQQNPEQREQRSIHAAAPQCLCNSELLLRPTELFTLPPVL